jgi:thioredoxin 1
MKVFYKFTIVLIPLVAAFLITGCSSGTNQKENEQTTSIQSEEAVSQKPISDKKDPEENTYKVTFIELGSVRCIPCQKMQPIMESVEEKYGDQVKVVFYDVWTPDGAPYAQQYGIQAIPTQVFLDENGEEYFRHVGFFPEDELMAVLKQKGVK